MLKRNRVGGFYATEPSGFLVGTFLARARIDVLRALEIEWGAEAAASFLIRSCPKNTVGEGGMEGDRFVDLTGNEGWSILISHDEKLAV